jgi:hypothetical protein
MARVSSSDMPTPKDPQQALQDALTDLQARRAVLGDALVDAALAPLLERLASLSVGCGERAAAAGGDGNRAANDLVNDLQRRSPQAEALWRGGQAAAAVAIWQVTAKAVQQRGDEAGARALRLRLADALTGSGQAEDIEVARQAVPAELPALQARDALAMAEFPLAARLAAWRVLHRAADPAAAGQLALAAAELAQVLNGFSDPAVRERVCNTMPWHRDVVAALALAGDAAG